jgi:hypothetical protein
VKVVEYEMWTPDWQRRVQAGKWKDYPGYGKAKRGRIGLQDHGNRIWFRNIKLRTLQERVRTTQTPCWRGEHALSDERAVVRRHEAFPPVRIAIPARHD